ncbi:DUF547 domain-containing protein [Thalassospira sp. MA62]|nr:DUF547 domain-containing protein [Thalassospira sp. MA62]
MGAIRIFLLVMFGMVPVITSSVATAAPKADLWDVWLSHDPSNTRKIDHAAWQDILDRFVIERGAGVTVFNYDAAKGTGRLDIANYVDAMQNVAISTFDRDQQFAFWVNLYNALTIAVVLDHYPVDSIRDIDISPGWFSSGPWGSELIAVEGRALGLDDIEHRILRPIWRDARIHYAVNCASIGCPALAPVAFDADKLDAQLDQAAKNFINHPRAVRTTQQGGFVLSRLYDWYRSDFGQSDLELVAHLATYADDDLKKALPENGQGFNKVIYEYDWSLNRP